MFEFTTITPSQQTGFGMPMCGRVRPDAFGTAVDATRVSGYGYATAAVVLKGIVPGTSAWSPPI